MHYYSEFNMSEDYYHLAFERQKKAREQAEKILEDNSRELYQSNIYLKDAYEQLKQQKLQLIHQEKLASIGQLSAGVAHEINNPIGFVSNNLEALKQYSIILTKFFSQLSKVNTIEDVRTLQQELDVDYIINDIDDLVKDCLDGAERIRTIVKGLKNFSRNDKNNNEVFPINQCIENTLKLVQSEIKHSAVLMTSYKTKSNVIGNQGRLSQVLLNLVMNASQAIEFRKKNEKNLQGTLDVSTKQQQGLVLISIKDNGSGISEENLKHIFDPFFTTKSVGEGTGLGLSISQNIIQKMGGSLQVKTKIGEGTLFIISLPINK